MDAAEPASGSVARWRDRCVIYLRNPDFYRAFDTLASSSMHLYAFFRLIHPRVLLLTLVFQPQHTYRGPFRVIVA